MSDRVRIGVIGAGWWAAENHIPVLGSRSDVQLVGVCRLGRDELLRVKEKFGFEYATENYRELLERIPMDGVVISSPNHLHYEHARAALEKGIHVLCEKPMVLRASDARELVDLTKQKSVHFLIPYGWSYMSFTSEAKRQIESGRIGEIRHLTCQMAGVSVELFSGQEPAFVKDAFVKPDLDTWSDPQKGGGYGYGQTTHLLGLVLWITGLEASEVFAMMGASPTQVDLFNAISARLSNGATAVISGCAASFDYGYQFDVRVYGTEGMLLLDLESGRERLEIRRHDGEGFVKDMQPGEGTYSCVEPLNRFVDLILGKEVENSSPAELGARVVQLLEAAYRSAASGKPEKVSSS